ncbi:MAG TPA: SRPBCC domain-containing protein [Opitutaceae bacterium]|nr:SRPBCC domain-containing protein [Opitutaceae bacterium]
MTTPHCELDLRPGGIFQALMRAPDGSEYPARGVFLEVVPDARIVFTDAFDPEWQPRPDMFFTAVTTFEPVPVGRTGVTMEARHWSDAACRRHEEMGFAHGWGESLDRLAGLAAGLRAG